MEAVMFFIAAIGAIGGAIGVVLSRNPFYSVLALIAHLFSLAVLFLLLTSAFVAAAQVVVYAGAVMVLYVFVVSYVGEASEARWDPVPGQRLFAGLLADRTDAVSAVGWFGLVGAVAAVLLAIALWLGDRKPRRAEDQTTPTATPDPPPPQAGADRPG